jgi:acyl carrier protein
MSPETVARLETIFRLILELEDGRDPATVRKTTEARWDSLAHTSLIAAIESEFDLTLDIADMERMSSFAATRLLLEEKGL